eukprot:458061-Prymnesium_polylepis.1
MLRDSTQQILAASSAPSLPMQQDTADAQHADAAVGACLACPPTSILFPIPISALCRPSSSEEPHAAIAACGSRPM